MRYGDILLVRGNTPASRAIRWATGSPFTHCALSLGEDSCGREWIAEIDTDFPAGARVNRHRDYVVLRPSVVVTPRQIRMMERFLEKSRGSRYDWLVLAQILLRIKAGWRRLNLRSFGRYTCVSFVLAAYEAAGIDLMPDWDGRDLAPSDLFRSPFLRPVREVRTC